MTGVEHFEQLYAESSDPWGLEVSPYERRKYELTVACLPDRRFVRGYEPACSVGVLTELLAARCDVLVASDPVARALATTGQRVPGAVLMHGALPGCWPEGPLDLVVLSEVLYYLGEDDRRATVAAAREALEPGGVLVSVHWRHPFTDAECDGDQVQLEIDATAGLTELVRHVEPDFVLVVLERG